MFYVAVRDVDCEPHYFHNLEKALFYISTPFVTQFVTVHPAQVVAALNNFVVRTEGGYYELEPDEETFGPMYSGYVQEVEFDDHEKVEVPENCFPWE